MRNHGRAGDVSRDAADELAALDPSQRGRSPRSYGRWPRPSPKFPTVGIPSTRFGCWPTGLIRLTGVDPFLRGACGTPGMARTFGTCGGDARDRMVRTRSGDGAGIAASSCLRGAMILRWWGARQHLTGLTVNFIFEEKR